jgi:hypothetical protein
MIVVRALERGYAHGRVIEPGEEFEWAGPLGKWMERVSPSPDTAEATPSPPNASAPSTLPTTETTVESLLKFHAQIGPDLSADQLTPSGFPKKTVFEERMGHAIPKEVFFNFIKAAAEQRKAAN